MFVQNFSSSGKTYPKMYTVFFLKTVYFENVSTFLRAIMPFFCKVLWGNLAFFVLFEFFFGILSTVCE